MLYTYIYCVNRISGGKSTDQSSTVKSSTLPKNVVKIQWFKVSILTNTQKKVWVEKVAFLTVLYTL